MSSIVLFVCSALVALDIFKQAMRQPTGQTFEKPLKIFKWVFTVYFFVLSLVCIIVFFGAKNDPKWVRFIYVLFKVIFVYFFFSIGLRLFLKVRNKLRNEQEDAIKLEDGNVPILLDLVYVFISAIIFWVI